MLSIVGAQNTGRGEVGLVFPQAPVSVEGGARAAGVDPDPN